MQPLSLTLRQARRLHLAAQGLLNTPRPPACPELLLQHIRRMGALQIDTIHVVARSPYLVLWSRVGAYPTEWLDALLEQGKLFEYWAHEASFLPVEDYPLYRHRMLAPQSLGWRYNQRWHTEHIEEVEQVLEQIRTTGPLRSRDFSGAERPSTGWWNWKPEKKSLEVLFSCGALMVRRREGFQRVYDVRERILPDWDDARDLPTQAQARTALCLKAIQALGLARAHWIADYFRMGSLEDCIHPETLARAGLLHVVHVQGWSDPAYLHTDHLPLLRNLIEEDLPGSTTTLLSPFDPIVWDRRRARELFDFDYRLESYTPASERQFGYYCLPILHDDQLIGRMDAKALRKEKIFHIQALHLEPGVRLHTAAIQALEEAVHALAHWHQCPTLRWSAAVPADFLRKQHRTTHRKNS